MMSAVLLRAVFTFIVAYGLLINIDELIKANEMYRRLVKANVNGLKHLKAHSLVISARYRMTGSVLMSIVVVAMLIAPPPPRELTWVVMLARICFVGIAMLGTAAAMSARSTRIRAEALIDAEIASTLPATVSERI